MKIWTLSIALTIFVFPTFVYAVEPNYSGLTIPVMEGAKSVSRSTDVSKGIHRLEYQILLSDHTAPAIFYNSYFSSIGWEHFMADTYAKYPQQFKSPPMSKWSSFSANQEATKYKIKYGSLWQNMKIGSDAKVELQLLDLVEDFYLASIKISVSPKIDAKEFLSLLTVANENPRSLIKLSNAVGGDPFDIDHIDIENARNLASPDEFIESYLKAVDSVENQMTEFAQKYMGAH